MLTAKNLIIFAKKLCHKYCNWQGPQYTSEGIFLLSIYLALREKCPDTELFLLRIFMYSDWVNLRIQFENRKLQTRDNSVFEHFLRSKGIILNFEFHILAKLLFH